MSIEKTTKASTRAKNKYRDKKYDRHELILPKGSKEIIMNELEQLGYESVNGFIMAAVNEKYKNITGKNLGKSQEE